jgi:hypothetical protein
MQRGQAGGITSIFIRECRGNAVASCENTIIVKNLDYDPQLVSVVGKISARDSGFSINCSETCVIDSFKKEACAIGADVVN